MDDIEQYYQIAAAIYQIGIILFTAYCLVLWVRPFLAGRVKAWYAGAAYAAAGFFFDLLPFPVSAMLAYISAMLAAFLVLVRIDREYIAQKLFLAVTFFCVRWQAWRIVACVGNEVFWLTAPRLAGKSDMLWFVTYLLQTVGEGILGCLLMYGAVRCLLWSYGRRREYMNGREFLLLVIPSVSGVFAYGVIRYYNYVYQRDAGRSSYELYGSHDLLILLYSVFCFGTILVMTYVFRQWKNEQEEEKRQEVFARQIQDLESHIAEVEGLYRDMRDLRHDMGNHLMTLEQLYDRGVYDEAEKYAEALKSEVRKVTLNVASGNPVTDIILAGQRRRMEEKGIVFDCDFHFPSNGKVNAFDISIILQNALSNAVEAVEREGAGENGTDRESGNRAHISVVSYLKKNIYMIEVSNSYRGGLSVDEQSGLPRTSKSGDGHGHGLVNIRHAARKYFGDIEIGKEIYAGEERCVLRVMLQIVET